MNEIMNFVKGILMFDTNEKMPVGLCSFETVQDTIAVRNVKPKKNKEMRLSELMDK